MHTMTELMGMTNLALNREVNKYYKKNLDSFFPLDIRTAYELEESVQEELREKYSKNLEYIAVQSEDTLFYRTGKIANWYLIHAPARIRCIAYILTMEDK